MPAWQVAAGEKLSFEVASIRPSEPDKFTPPDFPLSADDSYTATPGRLNAQFQLIYFIAFAYKVVLAPSQQRAILATLPAWAAKDQFSIHAVAEGKPTKDQLRVMMQALLAERFGLRLHFETQTVPVLALTLAKPGKTGPQLIPHAQGPPCEQTAGAADSAVPAFPRGCYMFGAHPLPSGLFEFGSRNTSMAQFAAVLPTMEDPGYPIVDETGLAGTYDFRLSFVLRSRQPPMDGPEFVTSLKDQLGLVLKKTTAPLELMVIDHVEAPTPN